jgi:error-prone DNA polymerase
MTDMSGKLASIGKRNAPFPLSHGCGDEFHGGSPTPDLRGSPPKGLPTRDIFIPDLHIDRLKVSQETSGDG